MDNSLNGGALTGKQTGWRYLDKYIGGYNEGDLIVIAGRPGMGKTAIALTLTKDFAKHNYKALFLSLEMSNDQLAKRYISLIGDIENWKIRNGRLQQIEIDKVINSANNQMNVGEKPFNFNGIEIVWCPGMSASKIVAAQKSNLFFGTGLMSDYNEVKVLDMANIDGSQNYRIVMRFTSGVQFGIGQDIVYYGAY